MGGIKVANLCVMSTQNSVDAFGLRVAASCDEWHHEMRVRAEQRRPVMPNGQPGSGTVPVTRAPIRPTALRWPLKPASGANPGHFAAYQRRFGIPPSRVLRT